MSQTRLPTTPVRKSIRHSGSIDGAVWIEATESRNQNRVIAFVAFFYDPNESVDKVAKHICRAAAKPSKVNAHLLRLDEVSKTALTCFVCEHDVPVRYTRDREDELHVIEISAPFGDFHVFTRITDDADILAFYRVGQVGTIVRYKRTFREFNSVFLSSKDRNIKNFGF